MLIKLTDFEVYESEQKRYGLCANLARQLDAYNNCCRADAAFKYLNRPLPKGTKPDDQIDCTGALPELMTIDQLADKAGIKPEEARWRLNGAEYIDNGSYDLGETATDSSMFYWFDVQEELEKPLITINGAADKHKIDRRTLKKYMDADIAKGFTPEPFIVTEGSREYSYYKESEVIETIKARRDSH